MIIPIQNEPRKGTTVRVMYVLGSFYGYRVAQSTYTFQTPFVQTRLLSGVISRFAQPERHPRSWNMRRRATMAYEPLYTSRRRFLRRIDASFAAGHGRWRCGVHSRVAVVRPRWIFNYCEPLRDLLETSDAELGM